MQAPNNLPSAIQAPKSQLPKLIITTPTPTPKNLSPATPHPEESYPTLHPLSTTLIQELTLFSQRIMI